MTEAIEGAAPVPDPTAGAVVSEALRGLVREFDETEKSALAGEPDAVHQHRTAVRRLRGVLRVFGELYDARAVARVRGDLKQWGSALGVVRDQEVAAELAEALFAEIPDAGDHAAARRRLVEPGREAAQTAHRRLTEIHDLERHREARRFLHAFADDPPLSAAAEEPARALQDAVMEDGRRVLRKADAVSDSLDTQHELRKAARRFRHAVEAATSASPELFGKQTERAAKAAHRIQSRLGDHRDALLLVTRIERARVHAGRAGEDTLVYDRLEAAARDSAAKSLRKLPKAQKKLRAAVTAMEG